MTPISGAAGSRFATVEGFQESPERRRRLLMNIVAPKYFETFGTPLVAGRDFRNEDEGGPRLAIVNQAMSRYYFGDGSPLGKHVTFEGSTQPYEIVGLVGDAKYDTLRDAPPRTIYLHAFQDARNVYSQFALRTALPPASVASEVRRAVADVATPVRVAKMTTLAEQVDASIVPERVTATLSGLFGALGALLAAIGLYGLLAYTVARRRNEIGIRMALGATRRDVTGMVVKSAMALVAAGLLIGVPLAFWVRPVAARVVENLPADSARPIVLAAAGMLALAMLAAWLPARRAARVEPMDALRLDR
jgi:predicted permease